MAINMQTFLNLHCSNTAISCNLKTTNTVHHKVQRLLLNPDVQGLTLGNQQYSANYSPTPGSFITTVNNGQCQTNYLQDVLRYTQILKTVSVWGSRKLLIHHATCQDEWSWYRPTHLYTVIAPPINIKFSGVNTLVSRYYMFLFSDTEKSSVE